MDPINDILQLIIVDGCVLQDRIRQAASYDIPDAAKAQLEVTGIRLARVITELESTQNFLQYS